MRWAVYAACAAAVFVLAERESLPLAWFAAIFLFAGTRPTLRATNRFIARRAFVRVRDLVETARFDAAHAHLADLRRVYAGSAGALELLRVHEATVLVYQKRVPEAIPLFESIDRRRIQKHAVPWLLNNLAWALVQAGEGARAVTTARESIEASGSAGDRPALATDLRGAQLGTLGAALVVAGSADEAVEPLEQALARGGTPRQMTARAFYLGEAHQALGHHDEARVAWKRATEASPEDELAGRARERLDAPAPPYRS